MHTTANRNKRSLTLDLRQPEGATLFLALARSAPTWWSRTSGPGTIDAWGIGYEQVRAVRPDVVYVSISGFGQFGPDRERAGYDPMAQAASGWLSLNGEPGGAPVKAPTFIGDDLGGPARRARARWPRCATAIAPAKASTSTSRCRTRCCSSRTASRCWRRSACDLPRMGSQFVVTAPADVYRCRDDYVMMGVLLDAHWRVLAAPARPARSSPITPTTRRT